MISQASIWGALVDSANNGIFWCAVNAGAPVDGTTGANLCGPGSLLIDYTNKVLYINTNTKASPTWTQVGGSGGGGVTLNGVQTLTNKTLGVTNTVELWDSLFTLDNHTDATKQAVFDLASITTGTKRTITVPDANITLVGLTNVQTLAGKLDTVGTFIAAGSTQSDGIAITTSGNGVAYVTGANATKGAVLPAGVIGQRILIANDAAANAVLKIYGNAGDSATIDGTAGSTAYSMAAKSSVEFIFVAAAKWQTQPLVAS